VAAPGHEHRSDPTAPDRGGRGRLSELALLFLRLGATAFGGPAGHIALMDEEIVRRRRWITREEFLDLLGAANVIPGPTSTEMAIHVGHRRAGVAGLVVAGACFILPSALIVTALAAAYARGGGLPAAEALLDGVKPVVVAIVARALVGFVRTALRDWTLAAIGALAAAAAALGAGEITLLAAAGVASLVVRRKARAGSAAALVLPLPSPGTVGASDAATSSFPLATYASGGAATTALAAAAGAATPSAAAGASSVGLLPLFLTLLKIGSVLFGSGYVLLAFLRTDLVQRLGWITEAQLLDAVAVGQVTPGPLFTSATFIGFLVAGVPGAAVATVAIFLPSFVFVALSGPLLPRVRRSPSAGAVLDGVNAASVALMAVVSVQLARAAIVDLHTGLLAAGALAAMTYTRVGTVWLIAVGAVVGIALR